MTSRVTCPGNLPADSTPFIGRRHLLDSATHVLATARLVTLVGVGGVGKTRAAIHLGRSRERATPGGVWLIDLATVDESELVARVAATALGIRDHAQRPMIDTVVAHLRERPPALLILDNCEHVITAAAELVDALLRHTQAVRILATSRQHLAVAGERILHVEPMTVPTAEEAATARSLDALAHHDSVRLFLDRVTDIGGALTDQDTHTVGQLVQTLQGVPLALELAAARSTTLSVGHILDRLDDPLDILTAGNRVSHPPHHQSLAATLTWSYHLCSAAEQRLWARLAVFTSHTDLDAIAAVCTDDQHLPANQVMNILDGLARQSLITTRVGNSGARYHMLETVRAYGLVRLTEHGEETAVRQRHRTYYRALTELAAREHSSPRQRHWMTRLREELPNIRAALTCAVSSGDTNTGLATVLNITRNRGWFFAGSLSEARYWSRTLLAQQPDTPLRLPVLAGGAWFATCQGDQRSALSIIADCLRILRDTQTPTDVDIALLAFIKGIYRMFNRRDLTRAATHLAHARDAFDRAQHHDNAHTARLCLAITTALGPDPQTAFVAAADCLANATTSNASWNISWARWAYGLAHLRHGDPRHAATQFTTALHTQHDSGDQWGPPWTISALAWHAATTGQHHKAALLLGAAHRQRQLIGVDIDGMALFADVDVRAEAAARTALGALTYATAYHHGAALDLNGAIAAALTNNAEHHSQNHDITNGRPPDDLTRRERDIAHLLGQDASMTNKEMATKLYISVRTVDSHIAHILRKLGLTSRAQIAVWASARSARH